MIDGRSGGVVAATPVHDAVAITRRGIGRDDASSLPRNYPRRNVEIIVLINRESIEPLYIGLEGRHPVFITPETEVAPRLIVGCD